MNKDMKTEVYLDALMKGALKRVNVQCRYHIPNNIQIYKEACKYSLRTVSCRSLK
jgi:hypothetical protein